MEWKKCNQLSHYDELWAYLNILMVFILFYQILMESYSLLESF